MLICCLCFPERFCSSCRDSKPWLLGKCPVHVRQLAHRQGPVLWWVSLKLGIVGEWESFSTAERHIPFSAKPLTCKFSAWETSLQNLAINFEVDETPGWWRLMVVGRHYILEETGPVLLVECCSDERRNTAPLSDLFYYFLQYCVWEIMSRVVKWKQWWPLEPNSFDISKNKLVHPNKNMIKAINLPLAYFNNSRQDKKRIRMKHFLFPSLHSASKYSLY